MAKMDLINLTVQSRSGKELAVLQMPSSATTKDLSREFYAAVPKYAPERQWFTTAAPAGSKDKKASVHLEDGKTLASYGLNAPGAVVTFKDLGPQIGWRTVFLIEYFGPMVIHPICYAFSRMIYGRNFTHSPLQLVLMGMMVAHFAKRELETMFVHRFSHGTMPVSNLFKNSFHYWALSGFWLAYELNAPSFAAATAGPLATWQWATVAVWAWAELSNLSTHLTLRNLRPAGSRVRKIPYGYGFSAPFSVSCPNYFFETIAWLAVVALGRTPGSVVFTVFATYQMFVWAVKKHKAYKADFTEYPKSRKAMFPLLA